ncbi:hypothetical protein DYBT9275_04269 [Dyadobacter sp. CECT 9275]|uniref:FecR family protein n=1 Tax=Dyadobacter helix TaxID=2822344 RepID=A0A916JFM8_9BACT|nr:FecR domain-containing protein [Dyadobacter sp. CECT 9275]CAG5008442.1 hypothetical protein DYBT9275_04269 [Dyadobacter sp. CECT 9275]
MNNERLQYLLERQKAMVASPEEEDELDTWYKQYDERPDFTASLSENAAHALQNRLFEGVSHRLNGIEKPAEVLMKRNSWFSLGYKVAAAVFILVLAGGFFYKYYKDYNLTKHTTAFGETRRIVLPDGSKVILNGNSQLTYPSDWGKTTIREVSMRGEAYFTVVHTADNRKFRVYTDHDFSVEVLGTQFTVSDRESGTRVVLNEGKVQCNLSRKEADTLLLKPGDLVEFSERSAGYVRKVVEASVYSAWKDKELILKDTPLSEISTMLSETYGLELVTDHPELLRRQVTGRVPMDNVNTLLDGIAMTCGLHLERRENKIFVSQR